MTPFLMPTQAALNAAQEALAAELAKDHLLLAADSASFVEIQEIDENFVGIDIRSLNFSGQLIVGEYESEDGELRASEFIIFAQSPNYLYGVSTTNAYTGRKAVRLPIDRLTIIDNYRDDDFIRDFADRLNGFADEMYEDNPTFDSQEHDAAHTTSRILLRMLERQASPEKMEYQRIVDALSV